MRAKTGRGRPVVRIVEQASGEMVKITRARDGRCRPGVLGAAATYTVRVAGPGVTRWTEVRDLKRTAEPGARTIETRLDP